MTFTSETGIDVAARKKQLLDLNRNLNILLEREARYGGQPPLELVNQIDDHRQAITFIEQALAGDLTNEALDETLTPLLLALQDGQVINITAETYVAGHLIQNITHILTAAEEAAQAQQLATQRLAEGVRDYLHRLQAIISTEPEMDNSPYKGLLAYRLSDAELFYGRDRAINELLPHLQRSPLTILHAESGAGKSSLLQAGIANRLLGQGHLPVYLRPYDQSPTLAIKWAFLPNLNDMPELAEAPLRAFLRRVTGVLGPEATLYLMLDQFEELFTLLDDTTRSDFVGELADCLEDETLNVRWVLSLRTEFFGNLANFRPRIRNPFENDFRLNRLNLLEAKLVITEPPARQGISFEPELVGTLLMDLHEEDSDNISPSQIQLVCSALYNVLLERRAENPDLPLTITLQMYHDEGQAQGILCGHLSRVLRRALSPKDREAARQLLIALVSSDQRRIRRTKSDLAAILSTYLTAAQSLDGILDQLVDSRLLNVEEDKQSDDLSYELAHDLLAAEIELDPETQARKAAQELLKQEVETFIRYDTLLSHAKFDIINSQREFLVLDDTAQELLQLSQDAIEAEAREREAQRQRELEQQRALAEEQRQRAEEQTRSAKRLRSRAIILAGVTFLAVVVAILAIFLWIEAVSQRNQAASRELAASAIADLDSDPERSILLALAALDVARTTQAENALHQALTTSRSEVSFAGQDEMYGLAFSPDGTLLTAGGFDQQITIWNLNTRQAVTLTEVGDVYGIAFNPNGASFVAAHQGAAASVWDVETRRKLFSLEEFEEAAMMAAYSHDGRKLAVSSADGTAKIWDAVSGNKLQDLVGHSDIVYDIAFSPDNTQLATASGNGTVKIWDVSSGQEVVTFCCHTDDEGDTGAFGVAFSPDGAGLATVGQDSFLKLWDLKKPDTPPRLFRGHLDTIFDVAFSLDGTRLATASFDHTAKVWDSISGEVLFTLAGHRDFVNRVAFSPDQQRLATASSDGTVRVWNIGMSRDLLTLDGHQDGATSVEFSPDGQTVATASGDGTVTLWNVISGQSVITMPHLSLVSRIAFSPDGQFLVAALEDGQVMLWDLAAEQVSLVLAGHTDAIYDVAFSPDGRYIATASADGTAKVWQASSGEVLKTLIGHTDLVNSVTFSPDGRQLLTASDDGTAKVWDVEKGQELSSLEGHLNWVLDAAFNVDGSRLATGGIDGKIIIYQSTGQQLLKVPAHLGGVNGVAFSPDGARLASAGADGIVKVWDPASGEVLLILRGHTGPVYDLAFSPDGTRLASASADGQVRLYLLALDELMMLARRRTTRSLTPDECSRYLHQTQCP